MHLCRTACAIALMTCATAAFAQQTFYVSNTAGDDAWTGLCELWDGLDCGPKRTIKAAVDLAQSGDTIIVADGVYTGWGNFGILFAGRDLIIRSANGPANCTINCGGHAYSFATEAGETPAAVIEGFTLTGGLGSFGGGIRVRDASPTIRNCVITANTAHTSGGGGISLVNSQAVIEDCSIVGNFSTAYDFGGGGIYCENSSPTIRHTTIASNWAYTGGGLDIRQSTVALSNCLIANNDAEYYGGGIFAEGPQAGTFATSTIAANSAGAYGGGFYGIDHENTGFLSCAVSDNMAPLGPQIAIEWYSRPGADFSAVEGGDAGVFVSTAAFVRWTGTNVFAPAGFADAVGGDFHLAPGSPCRNAADPLYVGTSETDYDGDPRVMGGRLDIGVDEIVERVFIFGDVNCDGVRDNFDIDPFVLALTDPASYAATWPACDLINADCNGDGVVDLFDVDAFVALLIGA